MSKTKQETGYSMPARGSLGRRGFMAGAAAVGAGAVLGGRPFGGAARAASHGAHGLDGVLADAVAKNDVPFAVAMWGDAAGVNWTGTAGDRSEGAPATLDTMFRIYSMTKAVGSTAAMILIDQGKLEVDTPVESVLPQFADMKVLDGFDGDTPVLRAPKTKATIRHLTTHTSGLVYDVWNADMQKYMQVTEAPGVITGQKQGLMTPMVFDPGARWDYGIGIDWLGQVVEAVDGRRVDAFCQAEIFDKLGMKDTVFEVDGDRAGRLCTVYLRGEDGNFAPFELAPPPQPEFYGMGHALYSTAPDYMRFLRMFLNRGQLDGERVLSEGAVDAMLENHIGDIRIGRMTTYVPPISADVDLFPGTDKTHSFAFLRVEQDVPGMRSAGSQGWAGVCNTHYWFDPARDVAGLIMTQSLPFVEPQFMQVYAAYERAVYAAKG